MLNSSENMSSSNIEEQDDIDIKGILFNNKYVAIEQLGAGACSSVWLVYEMKKKTMYAMKVQNSDDYDAGIDEVDILKKTSTIDCENLPRLIDNFMYTSDIGEHVCIVLELMACSLDTLLEETNGKYSKGFPFKVAKKITQQLINAVKKLYIEHKIIHTDIKPENILIRGTSNKVKRLMAIFNDNNLNKRIKNKINKSKKNKNMNNRVLKHMIGQYYPDSMTNFSSDSDSDSESEILNVCSIIDDKYLNDCSIVLSDYGNAVCESDVTNEEIQTRHYRAPEVILGCDYDRKCDIWSIACTFYELLTGDVLFFPEKARGLNTDRQHIYEIQKYLGLIPKELLSRARRRNVFFKKNGLMKRRKKIEYYPFESLLKKKIGSNKEINSNDLKYVLSFFKKTMTYPSKRIDIHLLNL